MVPLSGIGLSSVSRVFDVNVALCTTSHWARGPHHFVGIRFFSVVVQIYSLFRNERSVEGSDDDVTHLCPRLN